MRLYQYVRNCYGSVPMENWRCCESRRCLLSMGRATAGLYVASLLKYGMGPCRHIDYQFRNGAMSSIIFVQYDHLCVTRPERRPLTCRLRQGTPSRVEVQHADMYMFDVRICICLYVAVYSQTSLVYLFVSKSNMF